MSQRECDFRGGRHSCFALLGYFGPRGDETYFVCLDHGDTVTSDPTNIENTCNQKVDIRFHNTEIQKSNFSFTFVSGSLYVFAFLLPLRARARARGRARNVWAPDWKNKVAQAFQIGVEFETLHVWLPKKRHKTA